MVQRQGTRFRGDESDPLARRLKAAIDAGKKYKKGFDAKFHKRWAVEFLGILESLEDLRETSGVDPTVALREFRAVTEPILERYRPTYISPDEGSYVVACFEAPGQAAESAIEIQHVFRARNGADELSGQLIPSIGMNLGDVVYEDGRLHECHTCILAQRVQTQAKPGQILMCHPMYDALKWNPRYNIEFAHTARVKNIPEPQPIYQLNWENIDIQTEHITEKGVAVEGYPETLTIFYIDVCESARKFWQLGDMLANELIRDYHNFVEPVLKKYGCLFQKSGEGDQVMACFPGRSPSRAVDAAIDIQRLLFRRNTCMPDRKKIRAAVGLHIGEVLRRRREFVQTFDFQIAKAIQAVAQADEILISSQLYEILSKERYYKMRLVGTSILEGVPEPQDVYRIMWHAA